MGVVVDHKLLHVASFLRGIHSKFRVSPLLGSVKMVVHVFVAESRFGKSLNPIFVEFELRPEDDLFFEAYLEIGILSYHGEVVKKVEKAGEADIIPADVSHNGGDLFLSPSVVHYPKRKGSYHFILTRNLEPLVLQYLLKVI